MSGVVCVAWRCLAWFVAAVVGVAAGAIGDAPRSWAGVPSLNAATLAAVTAAAHPVTSRPDVVSAMVSARAQGSPVEAVDERTEFSSTWANPDGTLTTRRHYGQQRFKDAHGAWVEVNLSLRPGSDGSLTAQIPGGLSVAGPRLRMPPVAGGMPWW